MNLRDFATAILSRWRVTVVVISCCVGLAALLTFTETPMYESNVRLFVSTRTQQADGIIDGAPFASQRVASYIDVLGTRDVRDAVEREMQALQADAEPGSWQVRGELIPNTVNINIVVSATSPSLAQQAAQTYADVLTEAIRRIETPAEGGPAPVEASVIETASRPTVPVSPNPPRNLALGLALGMLLGSVAAAAREMTDSRLTRVSDLASLSNHPLLADIPADAEAASAAPSTLASWTTSWGESFRLLRTNMQYVALDQSSKVLVVSSSSAGEGKSTVATNLAYAMTLAGQRVAIVECDLRRPGLATRLNLDSSVGLTSVLIGKVTLTDATQDYAGLDVLVSGPVPPNPAELLQSASWQETLQRLRTSYDVIVLDAPPLLPIADSLLLAGDADGLVLVARYAQTTRDQVLACLHRAETVGARVVGMVMNARPARDAGYGYSSYGSNESFDRPSPPPSRT